MSASAAAAQAWDTDNPNAPLVGMALTGARIALGADFAEAPADYPRQVRALAAVALFRAGKLPAKAAARDCALAHPNQLSPSAVERAGITEPLIRTVVAYLTEGKTPAAPEPAVTAEPAEPALPAKAAPVRKASKHRGTVTRFANAEIDPASAVDLRADHPAVRDGHSIFTGQVQGPMESPRLLVSGHNNRKLGKTVLKGEREGWPIYHLTLEERATCPRSCAQWAGCYGNAMPYARRHRADAEFMLALRAEVLTVARQHPEGLLIRLHTLGDFFSVEYVLLWAELLAALPQLHVFGYTARREDDEDPATRKIAQAIRILTDAMWSRFAIRTSHVEAGPQRSIVVAEAIERAGVIMCPAQTGATAACATCTLCWVDRCRDRTIAFLKHGMKRGARQKDDHEPPGSAEAVSAPPEPAERLEPPSVAPLPVTPPPPRRVDVAKPRPAVRAATPKRAMPRGARIESLGDGVQVIRIKPISDRTLSWVRRYLAAGSSVAELADLFNLDADDLARRLGLEA